MPRRKDSKPYSDCYAAKDNPREYATIEGAPLQLEPPIRKSRTSATRESCGAEARKRYGN
jgi:hypothetical protein